MKTFYLLLLITAFSWNCKKSAPNKSIMQAKVDGVVVVCDSLVRLKKALDGTLYGIEGYGKGNIGFSLLFPIGRGTGTYPWLTATSSYQNEAFFFNGINNAFKSTSGSVTVVEAFENRYQGTFSFSFSGSTRNVTEGEFDISY